MKRLTLAAIAAALLTACGEGAGAEDTNGVAGAPDAGAEGGAPPAGPGSAGLALELSGAGPGTPDVQAFRVAPSKVAFHFGDPTEPLFDGVPGRPVACAASVATFVTEAPAEARLAFDSAGERVRLGGLGLDRGALLLEAWILIERGSAQIERPGGQLRSVRLPVCEDEQGKVWSVVRAVSPRRGLVLAQGAASTATIELRASSFIVETVDCSGPGAAAECASAEDENDDGDPRTRRVYTLHSLPMRAGP